LILITVAVKSLSAALDELASVRLLPHWQLDGAGIFPDVFRKRMGPSSSALVPSEYQRALLKGVLFSLGQSGCRDSGGWAYCDLNYRSKGLKAARCTSARTNANIKQS